MKEKNEKFNDISGIEILSKRGKKEKHFLQKDGTIIAKMYSENIHFKQNGKYEEIDNRLEKVGNYYKNKNNSFNVYFKNNSNGKFLGYELGENNISFELINNNNTPIKLVDTGSQFTQIVLYENVFDGIDFEYNITPTKVKEKIIIKNKESRLDEINFKIETDLELNLNRNGHIDVIKEGKFLFTMDVPYMIDSNKKFNNNVKYKLTKNDSGYMLDIHLDYECLGSNEVVYPVVVDPTISVRSEGEVYDTYIYPGDTNVNRNGQDILKAGVERVNGQDVVNRALVKFDLPTIGTGSQICEAKLNLVSYSIYSVTTPFAIQKLVDVHRISSDWNENNASWATMNSNYHERIEASFLCSRSWEEYSWEGNVMTTHIIPAYGIADITSLVKKWYTGTPNYGIMLKSHKETYDGEMFPAFYSKNNEIVGEDPRPNLEIVYRNQTGLENYMNYQAQSFNNGVVYENTFNGNLVTSFELGTTANGKMPVNLNLIYNTNDVVLKNNYGLGNGYKFSLWQTIKNESISDINYLQYLDGDGTIHYFSQEDGIYRDEDGLNMIIEINSNDYTLKDKYGNIMKFNKINNVGYLSEMINIEGNFIKINYNSDNLIKQIVDADNQIINIVYETNDIKIISPNETVVLHYNNGKISDILNINGYTYFTYNENELINKIIDIDGTSVAYEYYEQKPYKVKKVIEYGNHEEEGSSFTMEYGNKSTAIIDNKSRVTIINFNEHGNPICTSNLKEKDDVSGAYGTIHKYGEYDEYRNKLMANQIPIKHVNNLLKNTSFEEETVYFSNTGGITLIRSDEYSYSGDNSLKCTNIDNNQCISQNINVSKGKYYTFSAYIKNTNAVELALSYIDVNNQGFEVKSSLILPDNEFNRYDVTINYPYDAISDLVVKIYLLNGGTAYIDDIQLEEGEVANHFNYIENSNFSNGIGDLECISEDNNLNRFEIVTLSDGQSKALKINMDPEYDTHESKTFNIKGKQGDEYNISFWYKNKGIIPGNSGVVNGSAVWLQAFYIDQDNIHTQHCVPITHLNPSEDEWQYFSATYITEADYDGFAFHLEQAGDANELYITNLSLFKSVSPSGYSYDEKGNLKTVIGNNKEVSIFEYDSNNQLINYTNPKGKKLMYEYDNTFPDKLINSLSEKGICSNVKYDSNGNSILTRLNKTGVANDITNGLYKIRIKGTDLYLKNVKNSIKLENGYDMHDCWYLEKVDYYYYIYHSLILNKYFTVKNEKIILSASDNDNSLFMLLKNQNGSYSFSLKNSNKYIKNEKGNLITSYYIVDDPSFEFYFETMDEEKFIETNNKYAEDGKFIKKIMDSNFNQTTYDIDQVTGLPKSIINAKNQIVYYDYDTQRRLSSIETGNRKIEYSYNENNLLSSITQNLRKYNFEYNEFLNPKKSK